MEEQQQGNRPPQVTIAAIAVIGGALLLLASGFDSMGNLQSVDLRERLTAALSSGSAHSLGITVDDVIGWMHIATLVTGAAAAAAAVLGWFALQRHRGARLALSALAVVLIVCAPFAGGILAAFVAVAIAMLWSGPARDWFAGRPIRERTPVSHPAGHAEDEAAPSPSPELSPASESAAPSAPPPMQGFGDTPRVAVPPATSTVAQPVWHATPAPVDRRPGGVAVACVLTWLFAGGTAVLFAVVGVLLAVRPDRLVARVEAMPQWQDANLSSTMIEPVLWAAVVFYLGWSLGSCLLAWFVWRQQSWSRILLVVSALAAMVLGLFALPASVPHLLACATVAGLLLGGNAGRWFARTPHPSSGGAPTRHSAGGQPPRAW